MCYEAPSAIGRCVSGGHATCFRGTCAYVPTTLPQLLLPGRAHLKKMQVVLNSNASMKPLHKLQSLSLQ